jgi:hypothetical protein
MIASDYRKQLEVNHVYEVSKSQNIRLLDVAFIGPMMIYVALKYKMKPVDKYIMIFLGLATIYYNWQNYTATKNGNVLVGGKGDTMTVDKFPPEKLLKGMQVEMEHTNDPRIALEIAIDHLTENVNYYETLLAVGL